MARPRADRVRSRAMRTKTTTNPVFFADEALLELSDEARRDALLHDQRSVDLLTWNLFASLERHRDRAWLADRLRLLGGDKVREPIRISLWTGRTREPRLDPSPRYLALVRERVERSGTTGDALDEAMREFAQPSEVPVRIESPDVLCLVDTYLAGYPVGVGGRDRLLELVDTGLDQAARLGKQLAVAVVYPSGTELGGQVSARVQALRGGLRQELAHRDRVGDVVLRELSWQQLLKVWESEVDWLDLGGQPVKAFLSHCAALGLR